MPIDLAERNSGNNWAVTHERPVEGERGMENIFPSLNTQKFTHEIQRVTLFSTDQVTGREAGSPLKIQLGSVDELKEKILQSEKVSLSKTVPVQGLDPLKDAAHEGPESQTEPKPCPQIRPHTNQK